MDHGPRRESRRPPPACPRNAGLASSRREHKIVFYALTDPGRELLDAHLEPTALTP